MEKRDPTGGQLRLVLGFERHVFEVSELNRAIQNVFSGTFSQIWLAGEVSGYRMASSGHHYFCLKDSSSQIKCVLFRNAGRLARIKVQDGLRLAALGSLEVYEPRGEYQFIVERLELQGTGSLLLAFEELKSKLAAEGLFRAERKKPLPRFPRRIGVVTSPAGAALQDMLNVLARRFPGLHIRLYPSQVQGEGSVEQLCTAIEYFSRVGWAEVVIVARGGGSIEDLWSFNDERLARAIAAATVPIVSGVGHETDFTIADFVADQRAPTPSAAAEVVIDTRESLLSRLGDQQSRMTRSLRYRVIVLSKEVDGRSGDRGANLIRRMISRRMQQVDDYDQQLRQAQRRKMDALRRKLAELGARLQDSNLPLRLSRNLRRREQLAEQLARVWRANFWQTRRRLDMAASHLVQLSPLSVLARGYAIVQKPTRQIVRSSLEIQAGEELSIRLHAGKLGVVVSKVDSDLP